MDRQTMAYISREVARIRAEREAQRQVAALRAHIAAYVDNGHEYLPNIYRQAFTVRNGRLQLHNEGSL